MILALFSLFGVILERYDSVHIWENTVRESHKITIKNANLFILIAMQLNMQLLLWRDLQKSKGITRQRCCIQEPINLFEEIFNTWKFRIKPPIKSKQQENYKARRSNCYIKEPINLFGKMFNTWSFRIKPPIKSKSHSYHQGISKKVIGFSKERWQTKVTELQYESEWLITEVKEHIEWCSFRNYRTHDK